MWKVLGVSMAVLVGSFLLIQLVPFGRDHTNPPVVQEPKWDRKSTRELAVRACYDCHSNQTVWPWYSSVAPASWLVVNDVRGGRYILNFSEWNRQQPALLVPNEVQDVFFEECEMPPFAYLLLHPKARLTGGERLALFEGFSTTSGVNFGKPEKPATGWTDTTGSWCSLYHLFSR